jgi:hypothetical protein
LLIVYKNWIFAVDNHENQFGRRFKILSNLKILNEKE